MTYYKIKCGTLFLSHDGANGYKLVEEDKYATPIFRKEQAEHLKNITGGTIIKFIEGD
ncbi:hypothetical protein [Enterococcus nangangensis]|uniref:hypothetical protein n=1 Tax=Enterococcus nangangensis TaxID=2559926 RepID=UPI001485959A|nr:hypothetical protein [Enterococcus nangangensis]